MAYRYALALGLLAALACASEAKLGVELPASLENLNNDNLLGAIANPELAFTRFLEEHGKSYTGNEFLHRLRVFERNLVVAVENQLNDPSAVHGVTRFFDLTEDEFATKYLGLKIPAAFKDHPAAPILPTDQLPSEFDWRTKGAVTPIKNQGICGSCYAFSAIGALEGAHFLATGELLRLSEQQVVDCDHQCDPDYYSVCDSGCMGGLMNNVFKYVIEAGGVVLEKDYPYTGKEGTCKFNDANKVAASVKSYSVVSVEEKQIEANLVKYGPLAIAINAAWMQTYVKGVSCPAVCNKRALNHGVLLVGYGTDGYAPARLRKKDYWIIKNSWGPAWGEEGFYKICSGRNMCGIQNMVSAVIATTLSTPEMADSVEIA